MSLFVLYISDPPSVMVLLHRLVGDHWLHATALPQAQLQPPDRDSIGVHGAAADERDLPAEVLRAAEVHGEIVRPRTSRETGTGKLYWRLGRTASIREGWGFCASYGS